MSAKTKRPNTIKYMGKKIANNGDENDYSKTPIGADSDNVDRPDNSTVEESLVKIETEKVEIIPVEALPESNIKVYPYIYALVKPSESKGILYEYKNDRWINYSNGAKGIWVGTKEECVKDFNNIESGTIVIIIKKKSDSGETHTHDYVCQITKEPTYSQSGIKTYTCFLCGDTYTEEIPALIDSINPAGVIRIGDNEYATWKDTISFDSYYKDDQTVTIEATDNETGVKEISYYLSNTAINDSSIGTVTWTPYTDPFTIQPNDNYIVYARITDNADNVTYICSDGIVMDNIPPVFEGLEDGGIYPAGTVLTVEEGATLSVNDEVVELVNNSYTFTEPMDNIRLSLTDRAGNSSSISIDIIHVHNYTQEITKEATCTEDGIITYTCECGDTYTETIPASGHHDFVDGICTVCGKSEYEDFELNWSTIYKTGLVPSVDDYTLDNNVIIPATFEFEGMKYKTTSIDMYNDRFYDVSNVTSLTIPNTVKRINSLTAFCNVESIVIPESVKELGNAIIRPGANMKSVFINSNLEKYDHPFVYNDRDLSYGYKLILGENITEIPYAFINTINSSYYGGDYSINEIEIRGNVTLIQDSIFGNLYKLKKIVLPANLKKIESNAFLSCTELTDIVLPDSIDSIKSYAFYSCKKLSITIPNTIKSIGLNAFLNVAHIYYNGNLTPSDSNANWGTLAMN